MLAPDSAMGSGLLLTVVPILGIVLDVAMVIYFLRDLYRPERRVYGGEKMIWALVIAFGSVVGCLAYLLFGREEG